MSNVLYRKIAGIIGQLFQLDARNAGPQLKNNGGVLEVRNAADSAYANTHVNRLLDEAPSVVAIGSTVAPTYALAAFAVIPQMTATATFLGGNIDAVFSSSFDVHSGDDFFIAIFLDGVEVAGSRRQLAFTGASGLLGLAPGSLDGIGGTAASLLTGVAAGSHTIDARWSRTAGTARAVGILRSFSVSERAG